MKKTIFMRKLSAILGLWCLMSSGVALAEELPAFTELVKKYAPAVVNISSTQIERGRRFALPRGFSIPNLPQDTPFHDFFGQFFGDGGENGEPAEEYRTASLGSGFIISEDGYVISNRHVVKDAEEIIVRLSDRREFFAKVIGMDEQSDIALLKIEAGNLPKVALGVKTPVQVGEWVFAIGSPFGFDHSVTVGVVSAKGRSLPRENYVPFIQTDVAINPGNSGGPLFNLAGEVIGVNSQIYSRSGGFMGLSFAIPINVAMDVVEQLQDKGHVSRGWLGVLIQNVDRDLAESFGMERPMGALVSKVLPEGPAKKAGVRVGDVILRFNGQEVLNSSDLPPMVGAAELGRRASLTIFRNGKSKTLKVVIEALPADEASRMAGGETAKAANSALGLTVRDLTDRQREESDLAEQGIYVERVGKGAALRAGIRPRDILLRIDNKPVKNTRQFKRLVGGLAPGRIVSVLLQRNGNPQFLTVKMPDGKTPE